MPNFEIITKGNSKLGKNIYHVNLPSGISCPGATEWCLAHCYTLKFRRYPSVLAKYAANLELWQNDPVEFEERVVRDLLLLKDDSVFRWEVSGDIPDEPYAAMIGRVVDSFPRITFYLYTRSYLVPDLLPAIVRLETEHPNLTVWRSTDESVAPQPNHRDARAFDTEAEARAAGYAVCPEQIGRKASCEECRLCFDITKDTFRLAFVKH